MSEIQTVESGPSVVGGYRSTLRLYVLAVLLAWAVAAPSEWLLGPGAGVVASLLVGAGVAVASRLTPLLRSAPPVAIGPAQLRAQLTLPADLPPEKREELIRRTTEFLAEQAKGLGITLTNPSVESATPTPAPVAASAKS